MARIKQVFFILNLLVLRILMYTYIKKSFPILIWSEICGIMVKYYRNEKEGNKIEKLKLKMTLIDNHIQSCKDMVREEKQDLKKMGILILVFAFLLIVLDYITKPRLSTLNVLSLSFFVCSAHRFFWNSYDFLRKYEREIKKLELEKQYLETLTKESNEVDSKNI